MKHKSLLVMFGFLMMIIGSTFAAEGHGDTGTIRVSWNEFNNSKIERSGLSVGKGYFNTKTDNEWNKYEVRFEITNKGSDNRKVRYLICIFDKSQNLIFAGSEDKGIDGLETKEVKIKEKIASSVKFDPETVYVRLWWE